MNNNILLIDNSIEVLPFSNLIIYHESEIAFTQCAMDDKLTML